MTYHRANQLLEDFHRHCRGQVFCNVDKILNDLALQTSANPVERSSVAKGLEYALLLTLKEDWEGNPTVMDAFVAYCDYFTPSIQLINGSRHAPADLLEKMVGLHCADTNGSPGQKNYQQYIQFLSNDKLPTHLTVAVVDYLVTKCAASADTNRNFPLHHVITVTSRYELRDCLSRNQQKILELESGSAIGFRRSEIAWGIKLYEIGMKDIAQRIFDVSDAVPRGRDLIWLKDVLKIEPKQSWQDRCWESVTANAVEAIVRYYIEVGGVEFPTDKEVNLAHLCDALMAYTHQHREHENERFGPLVDYLVIKSDGQSKPRYESLPRKMLEHSPLYMELKLQNDLGL